MSTTVITSAANPLVKRIRLLSGDRRARRREGAFAVEGVAPVWRAIEAGVDLEVVAVAPDLVAGTAAERLLAQATDAGVDVVHLSAELFGRLSGKEGPAGVLAIARGAVGPISGLRVGPEAVVVALHEVASPGNLGTVVRAAEAAGVDAVVTVGASTDFLAPAAVKAAMGSLFDLAVAHADGLDAFFEWAAANRLRVVTTSSRAETEHWEADWTPPVGLLLGSEGDGLSDGALARGDLQVRIPMAGRATSLNLAVAAGILIFQARRPALQGLPAAAHRGGQGKMRR